jgi:UDP-N-acetylmuramoylalanine--D-glutamate ligase
MVELNGKRVLVVGLGKSGLAAVRLLASRGAHVVANDLRDEQALGPHAADARDAGAELVLGSHEAELFTSVDQIVLSPGVPPLPALRAADQAGVPVASEIELASWFVRGTVVAVTGTNGKSTVTTMLGEMCRRSGRPTFVGGNLGTPLVDVVGTGAAEPGGYVVVELSSFQLERVDRFRANVAVSEDHLDRYEDFAAYAAAKGRIFHGQRSTDAAVVPAGDSLCASLARAGAAPVHTFGGGDGEVRVVQGELVDGVSGRSFPLSEFKAPGRHNADNACAAILAARLAGVEPDAIEQGLRSFEGLPHRMQHVRVLEQVGYYDDSKATNPGAAVSAIEGLDDLPGRIVLIAGGKDKGGSYEALARHLETRGRAVVLLGEAAERIQQSLSGSDLPVEHAQGMDDAVARARSLAMPGDVVVLAPACSSFDMYRSYTERGDDFQRAVRALEPQAKEDA